MNPVLEAWRGRLEVRGTRRVEGGSRRGHLWRLHRAMGNETRRDGTRLDGGGQCGMWTRLNETTVHLYTKLHPYMACRCGSPAEKERVQRRTLPLRYYARTGRTPEFQGCYAPDLPDRMYLADLVRSHGARARDGRVTLRDCRRSRSDAYDGLRRRQPCPHVRVALEPWAATTIWAEHSLIAGLGCQSLVEGLCTHQDGSGRWEQ